MAAKQAAIRNILMVTREYGHLAGAGGVKDVVSQLAKVLGRWSGRTVSVVLPLYGFMDPEGAGFTLLADPVDQTHELSFDVDINYDLRERREEVRVWHGRHHRVNIYLIDSPRFLEKGDVYTYTAEEEQVESWKKAGKGHYDYFAMNVLLQKAALGLMMILDCRPDIIHCHDGHTALIPAMIGENDGYRHFFRDTGAVLTIHNAGMGYHQEVADLPYALAVTGLPWKLIQANCLDGAFDPFLVASTYAIINTVSENYGRELQESRQDALTGWLGHTLLSRGVVLEGVTNGIDPEEFDSTDPEKSGIREGFDPMAEGELKGKEACKNDILNLLSNDQRIDGLQRAGELKPDPALPLFTFVGRLSQQKGVDVLLLALKKLLADNAEFQFLLLGSGGRDEELKMVQLAADPEGKGRICVLRGFDPAFAKRIYAAGDFFLVPSQYEPCGLTDFMAQLYGNLPIVHHVGGLVKVIDCETGLAYHEQSGDALARVMAEAITLYNDAPDKIREMQQAAVTRIHARYTWKEVMGHYIKLYKKAAQLKRNRN
ncbi:MAG: glycogen/starch synthase [Thermodesulfobacteriota bacterium]